MSYYLSVGAVFKNESHILEEWVKHYLHHGVDHFYLINDHSNDDFLQILTPYIEKGIITLYNDEKIRPYLGKQRDIYNEYILKHLGETKWLSIVDLDEFLWSPRDINLKNVLKQLEHLSQIQFNHCLYGSNGHINQPRDGVVKNFTRRAEYNNKVIEGNFKYIINTNYKFTSLNVHHATFADKNDELNKFILLDYNTDPINPYFVLNHYNCQSKEFWLRVKCTRGDADNYKVRDEKMFENFNVNEVEDLGLLKQNEGIDNK